MRKAVATLGMLCAAVALTSAQRSSDIEVATTIADMANGAPLRVQSDRQGVYVTSAGKTKQVTSRLLVYSHGTDWTLTTYYFSKGKILASNRSVFFDLSEQAADGAFPTPPLGQDPSGAATPSGWATAHLTAKCSLVGVTMTRMTAGAVAHCPGSLRFRALDGLWYRLSFQPENYPQVDRFAVRCDAVNSGGCTRWTISPATTRTTGDDPNAKSLNTLLHIDEGSGEVLAVGGDYYMSLSITVTR